jgi:hypothetical protein
MQYPAGTSFTVNKTGLGRAPLPYKNYFFDGIYSIASIRKINETVIYRFTINGTTSTSLSCNSCSDMDKIIAFCKNEPFIQPIVQTADQELP